MKTTLDKDGKSIQAQLGVSDALLAKYAQSTSSTALLGKSSPEMPQEEINKRIRAQLGVSDALLAKYATQ